MYMMANLNLTLKAGEAFHLILKLCCADVMIRENEYRYQKIGNFGVKNN